MLNEIVAHTEASGSPGTADSNDWIELHLRDDAPLELGAGWHLSDDEDELWKWQIPAGTVLPPRGFVVFDESTGFNHPAGTGFGIRKSGETIFLSQRLPDGRERVADAVRFAGQENDWAVARVPDGGAYWDAVVPRSPGAPNGTAPARVHLSEIFYHPPAGLADGLGEQWLEYVEIHNATVTEAALFGTNGAWRLAGGLDFSFPPDFTLDPQERILVVPFDPESDPGTASEFRSRLQAAEFTRLLGPFSGRLDNAADRIALERPMTPDVPGDPVAWVVVDEVNYADRGEWPAAADGGGSSLHRRNGRAPGTDPSAWFAAAPSPGAPPEPPVTDNDHDGLPDFWETKFGLNPADSSDALMDSDQDGLTNLEEFLAGTHPMDPGSVFRVETLGYSVAGGLEITFTAVAGLQYHVESSIPAADAEWAVVHTVTPRTQTQAVTVMIPVTGLAGFHRIRLDAP